MKKTLLIFTIFNVLLYSCGSDKNVVIDNSTGTEIDDTVTIKVYSNDISEIGFYEVPTNLENNANNSDFSDLTLGQARNHMIEIVCIVSESNIFGRHLQQGYAVLIRTTCPFSEHKHCLENHLYLSFVLLLQTVCRTLSYGCAPKAHGSIWARIDA